MNEKPTRSLEILEEERAVPWGDPYLIAWHRARYASVAEIARGRNVLDIGSGEGYGAALLSETARHVRGVDYSPAAVAHANEKYGSANLTYEVADARSLEFLPSAAFGLVTCFEVIEHLDDNAALAREIARVLEPNGCAVLSTPNAALWRTRNAAGRYHVHNLGPTELKAVLAAHLPVVRLFGQSLPGSSLHSLLKSLDVFNLRHRLVHSAALKDRLATSVGGPAGADRAGEVPRRFRFSTHSARQSQHLLAVAAHSEAAFRALPEIVDVSGSS